MFIVAPEAAPPWPPASAAAPASLCWLTQATPSAAVAPLLHACPVGMLPDSCWWCGTGAAAAAAASGDGPAAEGGVKAADEDAPAAEPRAFFCAGLLFLVLPLPCPTCPIEGGSRSCCVSVYPWLG